MALVTDEVSVEVGETKETAAASVTWEWATLPLTAPSPGLVTAALDPPQNPRWTLRAHGTHTSRTSRTNRSQTVISEPV